MVTKKYISIHSKLLISCHNKKNFTIHDIKHNFNNNIQKTRGALQSLTRKGILIATKHNNESRRQPNTHNLSEMTINQMKDLNLI